MGETIRNLFEAAGKGTFAFIGGVFGGCLGFALGVMILIDQGQLTSYGTPAAGNNGRTNDVIWFFLAGGIAVGATIFLQIRDGVQESIEAYRERRHVQSGHGPNMP